MRQWGWCLLMVAIGCAETVQRDPSSVRNDAGVRTDAMTATDAMARDAADTMRDAGLPQPGIYAWEGCPNRLLTTATDAGLDQVIEALDAGTLTPDLECQSGTECTEQPFGRCLAGVEGGRLFTRCVYMDCFEHADCPMGQGCGCWSNQELHCVPATCRADRDCPSGEQCLPWEYCARGFTEGFSCTTPEDECHASHDCEERGITCSAHSGHRTCEFVICD